jgi:hypothetical protein
MRLRYGDVADAFEASSTALHFRRFQRACEVNKSFSEVLLGLQRSAHQKIPSREETL